MWSTGYSPPTLITVSLGIFFLFFFAALLTSSSIFLLTPRPNGTMMPVSIMAARARPHPPAAGNKIMYLRISSIPSSMLNSSQCAQAFNMACTFLTSSVFLKFSDVQPAASSVVEGGLNI